jgi:hypothetical protein
MNTKAPQRPRVRSQEALSAHLRHKIETGTCPRRDRGMVQRGRSLAFTYRLKGSNDGVQVPCGEYLN